MARIRQTSSIKSKSNMKIYLFIIVLVVVLVVAGGALAVFVTNQELNRIGDNSGVGVIISVSGNDVIVKIINEGRRDELVGIKISISGVSLDEEYAYKTVDRSANEIVYEGLAYGIVGNREVIVKGYFNDGSTKALLASDVYFG